MDVKIAIIGGTGIADPKLFRTLEEVDAKTPFGKPSGKIRITEFAGRKVAFLPRHGPGHTIPPHMVNYRANIHALRELGVERVIGLAAVGSLREEMKPGDVVIPDQFIDMTKNRKLTFYEGPKTVHISVADPFCEDLRKLAAKETRRLKIPFHGRGTYVCVEGPRFSTKAESGMWRKLGADIVGMTIVPEAQLARELELCYLSLASVTDYDVWADRPVSAKEIIKTMKKNTVNTQNILKGLVPAIPAKRTCDCREALKDAEL
jgi:5'-methylthioadenosine phosphorylase